MKPMNFFRNPCIVLLAASLLPAWGQAPSGPDAAALADLDLEQLLEMRIAKVYGASRYEQKVTQAPASISIATADEIKKFGHRTLSDVLQSMRGLYVHNDRNYSYLGVRGFQRPGDYNTRFLVLIDGHRMNDNVYDAAYIGRENMIDVDLIERVEFIRGPSSSIYGNSAFFGVINIVTKLGSDVDGAEVSVATGSLDSHKARFTLGQQFKNEVELLLSGSFYTSQGDDQLYYPEFDQRISANPAAANNGVAEGADSERAHNFFTKLRYKDFTLSALFTGRTKEVPTASFGTVFNDGREATDDYRAYADLKYERTFNENVRVQGRVFYDSYYYRGTYPYDYGAPGPPFLVSFRDVTRGEWAGTEWQVSGTLFDRLTLLGGMEYREDIRQLQYNYDDTTPRTHYLNSNRPTRTLGLFTQGDFSVLTNLTLSAGVRYDHYFESFGGTANPRVGLIYNPVEKTVLKALYGQAFRAPNAYERFYYTAQAAAPELRPETVRTYELVLEQYLPRNHLVSVSAYRYEVEDLISAAFTPAGSQFFQNLNRATAHGLEFESEGRYANGALARLSYAVQRTEDDSTGQELSNSPRHLGKLSLLYPLYRDKVHAGLELLYKGSVQTLAGSRAGDYWLANLTLFSRPIAQDLEVSASVYNLFNTRYVTPGSGDHLQNVIPQDGRSFWLKMTYKF